MPHAPHPIEPHRSARLPLALVLGAAAGLAYVVVSTYLVSNEARTLLTPTLTAKQAAEAGLHKALYCLDATVGANCGGTFDGQYRGENGVVYGDATFVTTVTGNGHERVIESVGRVGKSSSETVTAEVTDLPPYVAPGFTLALQAGAGGAVLGAKSVVSGDVLSAGDLVCPAGATVSGAATVTKPGGLLEGCTISRDARADHLSKTTVGGNVFYAATLASSVKVAGKRQPGTPTTTEVPLPDFNLELWSKAAAAGTVKNGDYHPASGEQLGPLMVEGNLTIDEGVIVHLGGPVWVTGNITIKRGARVTINESFGGYGTVLLAHHPTDPSAGHLTIESGASFTGSGAQGSLLLAVATAADEVEAAASVSGTPGDVVLLAPHGLIKVADRAVVRAVAAQRLVIGQRASVAKLLYADPVAFAATPGGTWRIKE